ncbi:MAG: lytic transglycosylase domain-containing protein [Elusimicrobiota bacterium]
MPLNAASGKVILVNGKSLKGDISKFPDGSCSIALKTGSIKFEKSEIQRIILYSLKDTATEKFITAMKITPGIKSAPGSALSTPYDNMIHESAKKHKVDPSLVKAVMKAESNFKPGDVSSKGACGLMQLMPDTARLMGVKDIFSPSENISAGTRYLSYMLDEFDGDMEMALAAYNAGPSAVKKYKNIPPYRETKKYVKDVFSYYRNYKARDKMNSYMDEKGCLNIYNAR